jgi:hypothetical protein
MRCEEVTYSALGVVSTYAFRSEAG